MAWPTPAKRCEEPASTIGHGIYMCSSCQQTLQKDLLAIRRKKAQADRALRQAERELQRFAFDEVGMKTPGHKLQRGKAHGETSGGLPSLGKGRP